MRLQSQILQTLRAPEAQARLEPIVAQGACESRAAFGREVCAQFGFVDARGTAQLTACLPASAIGRSTSYTAAGSVIVQCVNEIDDMQRWLEGRE